MIAKIPDKTVEAVLDRTSIADVVGRYVKLKKQGRRLVGLCPFHSERTPSFSVDPVKGLWYCFGCQEGGSLFNFIMKVEGITFPEAVRKMGAEVGVVVEADEEETPEQLHRKRLLELLERCAQYYHELLVKSPLGRAALDYCRGRGLSEAAVERFRLGWAPDGGQALVQKLQAAGYSLEDGLAAGVLRERGGRYADTLRGRLVFPITNAQGKVLAFGGRVLGDGQPKYLNTPETDLYSKRRHLFGLAQHRGAISRAERAVVVEGYLDVISMSQAGVELGVASLGTSLTEEQTELLKRYAHQAILAYDADRAGEAATIKAIELFENIGLRVSIAPLPPGHDPDSLARAGGATAIEACLEGAIEVIEFLIARSQRRWDLNTPGGKQDFASEVLPAIGRIADPIRRDAYVVKVANLLHVSEQRLAWRLQGAEAPEGRRVAKRGRRLSDIEERLLSICATEPKWITLVKAELSPDDIQREDLRPLYVALFEVERRDEPIRLQDFLAHLTDEVQVERLSELLMGEELSSSEEDIRRLIRDVRKKGLEVKVERLRQRVVDQMQAGTLNSEDELYQEYLRLQQQLKGVR
ncbi:MAG: DNA primase [Vulcanimicrobiota bacterium]